MRFEDLSPEDQALVKTDFGAMDKVAAEQVKQASDCYAYGAEKIALEIADAQDKLAEEEAKKEKEEEEHKLDEEKEKTAAELGAFTERGVFDGLAKLGQERHSDPLHYFYPYMEQKIAEAGAAAALEKAAKAMDFLKSLGEKAKGHASAAGKASPHRAVLAAAGGGKKLAAAS